MESTHCLAFSSTISVKKIFKGLEEHGIETFIDDGLAHASTFAELLALLRSAFERLVFWDLRLNGSKCEFGGYEAHFLGHTVDGEGHKHLDSRIQAIQDMVRPYSKKQVKSYMGGINYFRDYAGVNFSELTAPITRLLQDDVPFEWTAECDANFEQIKSQIAAQVKLYFVDYEVSIFLRCDA